LNFRYAASTSYLWGNNGPQDFVYTPFPKCLGEAGVCGACASDSDCAGTSSPHCVLTTTPHDNVLACSGSLLPLGTLCLTNAMCQSGYCNSHDFTAEGGTFDIGIEDAHTLTCRGASVA